MAAPGINILKDTGSGRPFVLLAERGVELVFIEQAFLALSSKTRCILAVCDTVTDSSWKDLELALEALLESSRVRQASFVTFGATCALAQALALRMPKLVRTIVFVNGSTRAHPTKFSRLVDKLESFLPLGLPLRLHDVGFDAKPFLQRIRSPVLVVTTDQSTSYERSEGIVLEQGLPTAWAITCRQDHPHEFADLVVNFQEVPAKCPR